MYEIAIFLAGAAVGFFLRHAYQGKFSSAEAAADKAKSMWDSNK
jgi:hypothetical protein